MGEVCRAGCAGADEPGGGELTQRRGEREWFVEELTEGNEFGARALVDALGEVAVRRLEDEGRESGVPGAEMDGESGSETDSVDDDGGGGDGARGGKVGERGVGVGLHGGLGGVASQGVAVTAIVEEQDVQVLLMKELCGWEGVCAGAGAGGQDKSAAQGLDGGGDPPPGELGQA